jgi:hypothetical protein
LLATQGHARDVATGKIAGERLACLFEISDQNKSEAKYSASLNSYKPGNLFTG